MKTILKVVALVLLVAAGFVAGVAFERFRYEDVCLDMGGGQNPGDYPICVIKIP
ncbi:hypothetical protein L4174_020585 [Photobacterium sp. CCB-ST2H9]|uniref:hypothetical protein n=1 Tax=unclassified Photobacterium TaxID=2628852 RepID=UPI002004C0B7|nr:hypothetical protein [Photobacterium sp. CCB-ST2H9]UTM59112.1 hypothetical protein L4174_020585 [Photobacterium sp. CCB-ST2H9]